MLAAIALHFVSADRAHACGGLFCNVSQQVNQAAERIVFADNGDGTITAIIEIQYEGPGERFSWLLPVPGEPELAVSSTAALDQLQSFTDPVYRVRPSAEPGCEVKSMPVNAIDDVVSG